MHPADPKTEQEIHAFIRTYEESFNRHDATALAALCTEDAIQIGPEGPIPGRQAITKTMLTSSGNPIPPTLYARSTRSACSAAFRGIPGDGAVRSKVVRVAVIASTSWQRLEGVHIVR
jgi:Domain of unknown function (DUF4440)